MSDAPPSYTEATGRPTFTNRPTSSSNQQPSNQQSSNQQPANQQPENQQPDETQGPILPPGWVRQYDAHHDAFYFVDTKATPPRSIWHHPYEDDQYLTSLSGDQREQVQELTRRQSEHDMLVASSDDEDQDYDGRKQAKGSASRPPVREKRAGSSQTAELPPRPGQASSSSSAAAQQQAKPKLGRRLKDRLTGTTHEQRVKEREQRAERERQQEAQYLAYRRALQQAAQTGQRQLLGKDAQGNEIWVEPPMGVPYNSGYQGAYDGIETGVYPGTRQRFVRPTYSYGRPYGQMPMYGRPAYGRPGYGRPGYGMGMGVPLAGGLLGGALLGSLLF